MWFFSFLAYFSQIEDESSYCILRWVRAAVPRVGEPVFRVGVSQCGGPGWAVAPVLV